MSRGLAKLTARRNQRDAACLGVGDAGYVGTSYGYDVPVDFEDMQKLQRERDDLLREKDHWLHKLNEDNMQLSETYRDLQATKELLVSKFGELDTAKAKFQSFFGDCDLDEFEETFLVESALSTANRMNLPADKRDKANELFGALVTVWARMKANQIEVLNWSAGRIKAIEKLFLDGKEDAVKTEINVLANASSAKAGNMFVADELVSKPLYQSITAALLEKSVLGLTNPGAAMVAASVASANNTTHDGNLEAHIVNLEAQNNNLKSTLAMERRKLSRLRMQMQQQQQSQESQQLQETNTSFRASMNESIDEQSFGGAAGGVIRIGRSRRASSIETLRTAFGADLPPNAEEIFDLPEPRDSNEMKEEDYNEFLRNKNGNIFTEASFDYLPEQIRLWASDSMLAVINGMIQIHPLGSANNSGLSVAVEKAISTEIAAQVRGVVGAMLRAGLNIESVTYDAPLPDGIDQERVNASVLKIIMSAALYMEVQSLATMALTFVYTRFGNANEGPGTRTEVPHFSFEEFMKDSHIFDFTERPSDQLAEDALPMHQTEYEAPPIHDIPQPRRSIRRTKNDSAKEDIAADSADGPQAADGSAPTEAPQAPVESVRSSVSSIRMSSFSYTIRPGDIPPEKLEEIEKAQMPENVGDIAEGQEGSAETKDDNARNSMDPNSKGRESRSSIQSNPIRRASGTSRGSVTRMSLSRASEHRASEIGSGPPIASTETIQKPIDSSPAAKGPDSSRVSERAAMFERLSSPGRLEAGSTATKSVKEELMGIKVNLLRHNLEKTAKKQEEQAAQQADDSSKPAHVRVGVALPSMTGAGKGGLSALRKLERPSAEAATQPPPVIRSRGESVDNSVRRSSVGSVDDDELFNYGGTSNSSRPSLERPRDIDSQDLDFGIVYGNNQSDSEEIVRSPSFINRRASSNVDLPSRSDGSQESGPGKSAGMQPPSMKRLNPPSLKSPLARAWAHTATVSEGERDNEEGGAGKGVGESEAKSPQSPLSPSSPQSPTSSYKNYEPLSPSAKEKLSEARAFDLNDMD